MKMSKTYEYCISKTQKMNEKREVKDKKSNIQQIYESEKQLFLKVKMRELIKKEWNAGLIMPDFKQHYDTIIGKNDNCEYFWITINVKPNITFKELEVKIDKYLRRTFVKSYCYVYEQRGSEENDKELGEGLHSHVLIERDMSANLSPYDIEKRTRTAFKHICDSENRSILHFKKTPNEYINDKIKYMINKDLDDEHKDKLQKQNFDKKFRKQNNIRSYYAVGELKKKYNEIINNGETQIR